MFISITVNGKCYPRLWVYDDHLTGQIQCLRKMCAQKELIQSEELHKRNHIRLPRLAVCIVVLLWGAVLCATSITLLASTGTIMMASAFLAALAAPRKAYTQDEPRPHARLAELIEAGLASGSLVDLSAVSSLDDPRLLQRAKFVRVQFDWLLQSSGLRDAQVGLLTNPSEEVRRDLLLTKYLALKQVEAWLDQVPADT